MSITLARACAAAALALSLGAAGCSAPDVDVAKVVKMGELTSGWFDVGIVDGQNKLVPSASFTVVNSGTETLSGLQTTYHRPIVNTRDEPLCGPIGQPLRWSLGVLGNLHQFDNLRQEWAALLPRCATNSLFLTWDWQRAWWSVFGEHKDLRLITVRDAQGALSAVAQLFVWQTEVDPQTSVPNISVEKPCGVSGGVSRRVAHVIGGTEVSDYLDLL